MNYDLIFFYTGAIFWSIFGIIFLIGLVGISLYTLFLYFKYLFLWTGFKVMENAGIDKEWVKDRQWFMKFYSKEQRLVILAFIRRVKKELK